MPRNRNYREEYRRRIERGLERGLSRSQARGHPKVKERSASKTVIVRDERLDAALLAMNQGTSMTAAAKQARVSPERLTRYLAQEKLGRRKGRIWKSSDRRNRQVPVLTGGRQRTVIVPGFKEASLVGEHHSAVGRFVRTNDISILQPFKGKSVKTASGKKLPLETDPNELHRIAAMDEPAFHEIYEIQSNS